MNILTVASRYRTTGRDRGSLPVVMLVMIVGMAMAGLALPLVLTSTGSTNFETSRGHALHAAQSGMDYALGQVRGVGNSDPAIPCDSPLTGSADDGDSTYSVTIAYYSVDPRTPGSVPIAPCPTVGLASYIVITSTGNFGTRTRTLEATYVPGSAYRSSNGGPIRIFPESDKGNLCLMGNSGPGGTRILTLTTSCPNGDDVAAHQLSTNLNFAYGTDLTLKLVGSTLCVAAAGTDVSLVPCDGASDAQKWVLNGDGHLVNSATTTCLTAPAQSDGTRVTVDTCNGGDWTDPEQAWLLSPDVGAGAAEAPDSGRIVNSFGRCLDSATADGATMVRTCIQDKDPDAASTEKWSIVPDVADPAFVQIKQGDTCLASAGVGAAVTFTTCNADTEWAIYTTVDSDGEPFPAEAGSVPMFTIRAKANLDTCLTEVRNDAIYNELMQAHVKTCDGSLFQKWNVPLRPDAEGLTNLHEIAKPAPGGGGAAAGGDAIAGG